MMNILPTHFTFVSSFKIGINAIITKIKSFKRKRIKLPINVIET